MRRRHSLREDQWERIQPFLPPERGVRGRPARDNRATINAILWILKTGAPWRDLPESLGPWPTAYACWVRWTRRGIWKSILDELAKDADRESFMIDGTISRAHQDASGAEKKTDRNLLENREADRPQRFTLSWTPLEIPCASSSRKGKRMM